MISAAILSFSISLLAPQGAVASTERHATEVGLGVLEDGGNAVDAAIAIHFALGVTYPNAGNLGGGGFLVYRSPSGENIFLDFREVAPINATLDMYAEEASSSVLGWLAVAVPGAVPGRRPGTEIIPRDSVPTRASRLGRKFMTTTLKKYKISLFLTDEKNYTVVFVKIII